MTIQCEIVAWSGNERFTEYCEVSVFGRIIGAYDSMTAAISSLAGYLIRSYPGMDYALSVDLVD